MISKSELKFIRSLKNKKYRTSEKLFLVEGEKNVLELISSAFEVTHVLATADFVQGLNSGHPHLPLYEVSGKILEETSALVTNNQALAVARQKHKDVSDLNVSKPIIALDGINDPGNLGTIIRTADWFGIDQILCSEDCVEFYNPKVISATMGSFTRIQPVYSDLATYLTSFSGTKWGAEMDGIPLSEIQPRSAELIVMGSESHGIRPEVRRQLSHSLTIPGKGHAESLNVGVAFGIICSTIFG